MWVWPAGRGGGEAVGTELLGHSARLPVADRHRG